MPVEPPRPRTIWRSLDSETVEIIDQTRLPAALETRCLESLEDAATAIRTMQVRGAPLIGVTAAYGVALGLAEGNDDATLRDIITTLAGTRPTGRDLFTVLDKMRLSLADLPAADRKAAAWRMADELAEECVNKCRAIGQNGAELIERIADTKKEGPVNVLTHCNAGWLACVEWGTALAPVYVAAERGCNVHVWVGETRPRNQGAALTCWELKAGGVPHTLTVDSATGHLMSEGRVDIAITGADRVLRDGTVCNKIGTYMKALAAHDNDVPFYVAIPESTVDRITQPGSGAIPIEERDAEEVLRANGRDDGGSHASVAVAPPATSAFNPAFDVTPPNLVQGLVTEAGVGPATEEGIETLFGPASDGQPA
ncbi:MAG: S-methyl-5-thioribose-1-phosphate isomerase [Rhodospirillales bacterium]|nr:S-methyl-5-thioribose-1-phosphate isomerase [Rhodospirillales bacterium]